MAVEVDLEQGRGSKWARKMRAADKQLCDVVKL